MKAVCALFGACLTLMGCAANEAATQQQDRMVSQLDFVSRQCNSLRSDVIELRALVDRFCLEESPSGRLVVPCPAYATTTRPLR